MTIYYLPTLCSLYLKLKKTWMKRFPMRSLAYWGILAVKAANKKQENCLEDGIHLQRLAWDVTVTLHKYHVAVHISTGATPPHSFSIQHGGRASRGGRSPVCRSSAEVQAWWNLKCMTTLYKKEVWNKLPTRRLVPWNSRKRLCAKKGIIFPTRLQRQVDAQPWRLVCNNSYNYGWWQTRTSYECRWSQEILCQKIKAR